MTRFIFSVLLVCASTEAVAHGILPLPQSIRELPGTNTTGVVSPRRDPSLGREAYRLRVTPAAIELAYGDDAGRFYAGQTLAQLKTATGGYPCVEIDDAPRFPVRGIMIDESRHFFGKAFVLSLLERMSEYKLNTLQWHLNDDCGFRAPFAFDPKMATEGATRPFKYALDVKSDTAWNPDPNARQQDRERAKRAVGPAYGPYVYTEADVREIVAAAAARHIRVIPVLEVPGHATGLLRAHPEFTCLDENGNNLPAESCMEICVGNPEAIAWYDRAFEEIFRLFPDAVVHIGGDEVNPRHWNGCSRCRAFMKKNGIADWKGLQAWVTERYAAAARRHGKRIGGWDEIYHQRPAKDTVIWAQWPDTAACAAKDGYDVVRADNCLYYWDWPQGLKDDPHQYIAWKPEVNTFEDVWLTRVSCCMPEESRGRILGVIAANWTEFTRSPAELEWKIWPRALALAENLWRHGGNPISGRYAEFRRRAQLHIGRLRAAGINCAPLRSF